MILHDWRFFAIITVLFYSTNILLRRWLFRNKADELEVIIIFMLFLGCFLILFSLLLYIKNDYRVFTSKCDNTTIVILTGLASLFATLGLMSNNSAIFYVDDVAKSEVIVHPAQVVVVFLASLFLFKNKFNLDTFIGVFLTCTGMYFVLKH